MSLCFLLYLSLLDHGLGFILPLKTNTGKVDLQSVVTHITLLDEKVSTLVPEVLALKSKVSNLETKLATYQTKQTTTGTGLKSLTSKVSDLETKLATYQTQQKTTATELKSLKTEISSVRNQTIKMTQNSNTNQTGAGIIRGGATFIRWGRTSCPVGNTVVYKGFAAGRNYASKGGAGNMLCLSDQPIYDNHTSAAHTNFVSEIFGTEYEASASSPFSNLVDDDMPCAVCSSQSKHSSVMVPGRNQCFHGWTLEYWGYLMGPFTLQSAAPYICVDSAAEAEPGSQDNKDGNAMYLVESVCGSLNCPPYKDHWKLTCAVCSQ